MKSTFSETIEDLILGLWLQPSQLALRRVKKQGSKNAYLKAVPQRTLILALEGYTIMLDDSPDFPRPWIVNYVHCKKRFRHGSVQVTNPHDLEKITMLNALYEMKDIGQEANQMELEIYPPVGEIETNIHRLETHLDAKYRKN